MTQENNFPKWGFWIGKDSYYGVINRTSKVHLFLSEEKTACGYNPIIPEMQLLFGYRFSSEPKAGLLEFYADHKLGRKLTLDDFKKCKKCLKNKEKIEK